MKPITLMVEWRKNKQWGLCPKASVIINNLSFEGERVVGAGFDKAGVAVVDVLQKTPLFADIPIDGVQGMSAIFGWLNKQGYTILRIQDTPKLTQWYITKEEE